MADTITSTLRSYAGSELRKGKRFEVSAPVVFCWEGPDGAPGLGEGQTRNISDRGVFIECKCCPPEGARLEVNIYLPSLRETSRAAQLHGEGSVTRAEQCGGDNKGFAVEAVFQARGGVPATLPEEQKIQ